jgi:sarcosine oxidase gamma subunit
MLFFYTMKLLIHAITSLMLLSLAQTSPTGGASLSGIVVRSGTEEPLVGVQAILTVVTSSPASGTTASVLTGTADGIPSTEAGTTVSATASTSRKLPPVNTDRDGKFLFQNLEPGLYSLQVIRNEYARQTYGQRVAGGPALAIRLSDGQSLNNIVLSLVPAGNVSGVIRDSDGRPQTGVPIQLLRSTFNAVGERTFHVEGTARTNDRGEYRLYWITPGRYFISAGTASGPNRPLSPNGAPPSPNEIPDQSFALTYFPGVFDAGAAAIVEINPGAEVNGVDFIAPRQRLFSVRGRIVDSGSGRPPATASVSLAYRTLTGVGGAFNAGSRYDASTGEFELRNVPPGAYVVQAIAATATPVAAGEAVVRISALALQSNARMPIEISNSDINGVSLQLTTGVSIAGRIRVDGMPLSTMPGWENIRVPLKPTVDSSFAPNLQPAQPVTQRPTADGAFTIDGVSPGEFIVGPVTGLAPGFYVKDARFNQADVLGQPLRFFAGGAGTLEIVLSSKAGNVTGTTVDAAMRGAAGAQVVLVPERERKRTDLYKTAASDANGRFLFRSVPPGDYRLFGWEALESYAYFDQDLLRRLESQGVPVHVSESAGNTVTLKIISASR